MIRLFRLLAFSLFPLWWMRRELKRALWEAYVQHWAEHHGKGAAIQLSAAEFDAWAWLWSERRRLEQERDRFVQLCDGMNQRNAQLKVDLARATQQPKASP